ncbi:MAG: S8 family serine peptidase [Candidatus Omnitrophica bacterium]|nr:S8 family serine peptidase [Candidatus Omnitrophota bacterium]
MTNKKLTVSLRIICWALFGILILGNAFFIASVFADDPAADCESIGEFNAETCQPDTGCTAENKMECIQTAVAPNGEKCFACRPKDPTQCLHYNLLDNCDGCDHREMCISMPTAQAGICYDCKEELQCKHYELVDACTKCQDGQACKPTVVSTKYGGDGKQFTCYECLDKEKCEDYELAADCSACKENEFCQSIGVGSDPHTQTTCYECRPKDEELKVTCDDVQALDSCSACKETENCVPAKLWNKDLKCYYCVPKGGCEEDGQSTETLCKTNCEAFGGKCLPTVKAGNGEQCYDCLLPDRDGCEALEKQSHAMCTADCTSPGICQPTSTAPNKEECYECVKDCSNVDLLNGGCYPDDCPEGHDCSVKLIDGTFCHQCVKSPNLCWEEDALLGPCPADCPTGTKCVNRTVLKQKCHDCERDDFPETDDTDRCMEQGWFSNQQCDGKCPPRQCVELWIDMRTGKPVPQGKTVNRAFLHSCFGCIKEARWVIIIIETPIGRFVLGETDKSVFEKASLMALALVDKATDKILSTSGDLALPQDFINSLNAGTGPAGIISAGKINAEQISTSLGEDLDDSKNFSTGCFDDILTQADQEAQNSSLPTSQDILGTSEKRKKDKELRKKEILTEEQIRLADEVGDPAISGPILVCGNQDRKKVLKIYDAKGLAVATITRDMLRENPEIIVESLALAQSRSGLTDDVSIADQTFEGLPAKTNIPVKKQPENPVKDKKSKKKKAQEEDPVYPSDPLYLFEKENKKKLFGILGSSKEAASVTIGSTAMSLPEKNKNDEIKDQWGLHRIGFTPWENPDSAWNAGEAEQKNLLVAVIDSGLDTTHPDGPAYIWNNPNETANNNIDDDQNGLVDDVNGWNFFNDNNDLKDIRGHGTFVTGIISAKYNNGVGIAGINPGAVIMPIKVTDEEGATDSFAIFRAINYAVDHGAKIINASLGGRGLSRLEQIAVSRAYHHGVLVIFASGNGNDNLGIFGPSSSKYSLAVGQIDMTGLRSTVSNWGPNLGLLAPGEQIYSLCSRDDKHVKQSVRDFGYYKQNGTSFSTPMATGTASLVWAKTPSLSNDQVMDILLGTATDMDDTGWDGKTGAGLLNAASAVKAVPNKFITLLITNTRINRDLNDEIISIDVYGLVRGNIKEYFLDVGKGNHPEKFEQVAGPFTQPVQWQLIERVDVKEFMRGSKDWVFRLRTIDQDGREHMATLPFEL